ncbi:MAG: DUF5698 domain-containing protein [Candidatus Eisenbacteria bacterium]|nr:DUF5698 domain-containing protein [Candidatus Eisenbacteria bacterium]
MDFTQGWPVWGLAIAVFLLRIVDVSLGTVRTIAVVHGRIKMSVLLGFVEVLIWITVVSQVIVRVKDDPLLLLAYACGFAAGNASGIWLERKLAFGYMVVRIISEEYGKAITDKLTSMNQPYTVFHGEGRTGPRTLIYVMCARGDMGRIIEAACSIDPELFYSVEHASDSSHLSVLPHHTGWRAVFKKK